MTMLPPFPLVVGSGRSGTTLLRNILDSHPEMAMAHEAHFVAPMARRRHRYRTSNGFGLEVFVGDLYRNSNFRRQGLSESEVRRALAVHPPAGFAEAVRTVLGLYASRHGKQRYGDKTPGYVKHIRLLAEIFPEARFVHLIRDGRDVALGYLDRSEWGPATLPEAALYWRSRVERGRAAGRKLGEDRYLEVRYEDMVHAPDVEITRVCEFLHLDYRADMLTYYEKGSDFIATSATPEAFTGLARPITSGLRDWRTQMADPDVATFEALAGDLLADLGYERGTARMSLRRPLTVAKAKAVWQSKRAGARLRSLRRS